MRRRARPFRDNRTPQEMRVNDQIRVPRVILVDEEGKRLGEFMTQDAIVLAQRRGLDLVEVAARARPPVCRIADFGKMKYERQKKASEARKRQHRTQMKELKLRPKTDDHDMEVKARRAESFLTQGNKVKINVWFRGREHAHHDIGAQQCMRIAEACADVGTVELAPRMDGRRMIMVLAPSNPPS